jgi:type IV pilus assembly protein PilX
MKWATFGQARCTSRQGGAALIVSLVFLLIMTVVGLAGMQATSLEEKMAGNMRDRNLAFQAAESAIRAGESYLTAATLPVFDCTNGLYKADDINCDGTKDMTTKVWDAITDWSSAAVATYSDGAKLADVHAYPAYIVEQLPPVPEPGGSLEVGVPMERNFYRVTARGVGGTANAVVMVQSIYKR